MRFGWMSTVVVAGSVAASSMSVSAAQGQTGTVTVTGRVTANGKPVKNARVYVAKTQARGRTDANGNYKLTNVPGGPQNLVVRHRGFVPVMVEAKFSTLKRDRARNRIDVPLSTYEQVQVAMAESARIDTALSQVGFYTRQKNDAGTFLTPADIAAKKPMRVSDIFRGVPQLTVATGQFGGGIIRGLASGCANIYVDGLYWNAMFRGDLDTDIPAGDVIAAEIYQPRMAPAPFMGNRGRCDTVVLWTKHRVD